MLGTSIFGYLRGGKSPHPRHPFIDLAGRAAQIISVYFSADLRIGGIHINTNMRKSSSTVLVKYATHLSFSTVPSGDLCILEQIIVLTESPIVGN